ncbi:hypothetical protein AVEN_16017-1 [Araneus ventricosus]|uniref:Uncharacterized protein n=1 Tax=Araneus ventricosus TaxID=182803 RepID=A0A4Y2PWP6_ARAVE|nr:hypothetical protein AVEN_16017-1 [Araneus ventricosus]
MQLEFVACLHYFQAFHFFERNLIGLPSNCCLFVLASRFESRGWLIYDGPRTIDSCSADKKDTTAKPPHLQSKEIADALAKAGAGDASVPSALLTYLELFSRAKSRNKIIWLIPQVHHWYQGSRPGGCLSINCSRRDLTTLTRFLSGRIRSLTFSDNSKCFEICPKCTAEQATPDHIPACLGLFKPELISNPLLTLNFFRVRRT